MESKKGEKSFKKLNFYYLFIGAAVLLGILLMFNIFLAFNLENELNKNAEALKESQKPAKIEITAIRNSKCPDCFDISALREYAKSAKANITKEAVLEFGSGEANEFISKYRIERVPTVIITGEISKLNLQGFGESNGALLPQVLPPYTNAQTGEIVGRVTLYLVKDESCEKCNDLTILVRQLKQAGVKTVAERNLNPSSAEGKGMIEKYGIDFVPTLILSKDAGAYRLIQEAWLQIGTRENDGNYVLRTVNPPYINLTTGKLRGIVNAVYLADRSCTECYDVSVHKEILTSPQSFSIPFENEEAVDMADAKGKALIEKYNITQVPTIILSDEISAYPSSQSLRQFFSVEKDGYYVFRTAQALGAYKDLTANEVVRPQQSQGQV